MLKLKELQKKKMKIQKNEKEGTKVKDINKKI